MVFGELEEDDAALLLQVLPDRHGKAMSGVPPLLDPGWLGPRRDLQSLANAEGHHTRLVRGRHQTIQHQRMDGPRLVKPEERDSLLEVAV